MTDMTTSAAVGEMIEAAYRHFGGEGDCEPVILRNRIVIMKKRRIDKIMTNGNDTMKIFVKAPPFDMTGAFGNGYVVVKRSSPLYGKHYDDDVFDDVDVNGGMTYAGEENDRLGLGGSGWVYGFDTQHYGDNAELWPNEEAVLAEAGRLREQLKIIQDKLLVLQQ